MQGKISRKDFNRGAFKQRYDKVEEHPVTLLLKNNSGFAFTIKHISQVVKRNGSTVRGVIKKLVKRRLVAHNNPYFIWMIVKSKSNKKKR